MHDFFHQSAVPLQTGHERSACWHDRPKVRSMSGQDIVVPNHSGQRRGHQIVPSPGWPKDMSTFSLRILGKLLSSPVGEGFMGVVKTKM